MRRRVFDGPVDPYLSPPDVLLDDLGDPANRPESALWRPWFVMQDEEAQ